MMVAIVFLGVVTGIIAFGQTDAGKQRLNKVGPSIEKSVNKVLPK